MFKICVLLSISCLFLLQELVAQKTWNGSISDQWDEFDNWTPPGPPVNGESIIIPVTIQDPIRFGKSINIGASDSLVIHVDASLIVTGVVSDTAVIIHGDISNRGTLFISNSLAGLSKSGAGSLENKGILELTSSFSGLRISGGSNQNDGEIIVNSGALTPLQIEAGTIFNSSGTMTINGDIVPSSNVENESILVPESKLERPIKSNERP